MSTKPRARHGTARKKVLDALNQMGLCTVDELYRRLHRHMSPHTLKYHLTTGIKEGSVTAPARGFYCLSSDAPKFSPLYIMSATHPTKYAALLAVARKGRPWLPALIAAELAANTAKTTGVKASSYLLALKQLRREGYLYRPRGEGYRLMVEKDCYEALMSEGILKWDRLPVWLKQKLDPSSEALVDPELQDLLS